MLRPRALKVGMVHKEVPVQQQRVHRVLDQEKIHQHVMQRALKRVFLDHLIL